MAKQAEIQFKNGEVKEDLCHAINDFHHKRLCGLLKDHGGEVRVGNPNAHEDLDLKPTVIFNPKLDSPLMTDEIFGPILPVIPYKTLEEAIQFVNSREKPL